MQAEQLLRSRDLRSGDHATEAMELLLDVPEDQRAKVIDGLDQEAFENLLDRVPEHQRERLAGLVESSKDPRRKLRLWAALHKARAGNDLHRRAGDFGDEDSRTEEQARKLARYERRERGVESTNKEVDREVARLLAKEKAGTLTVEDIDRMRERKDLELAIEMQHDLSLTADTTDRADGSQVVWSRDELQQVRAALSQLPDEHIHDEKTFERLHRTATRHPVVTQRGEYLNDHIDIYDTANTHPKGHGGKERTMVSEQLRREHGGTIGDLEYTVTHEIGHDVEADHPEAFQKFKEAAGWKTVDAKALRAAGVSDERIEELDRDRRGAGQDPEDVTADDKVYRPAGDGEYYQFDAAAFPREGKADLQRWSYATSDPQEHFAEVYAKAVLEPEALYSDLVARPAEVVRDKRATVEQLRLAIEKLKANPSTTAAAQREDLTAQMAISQQALAKAEQTERQRGALFRIMRDDVFGTEKAVSAATARLRARKVSPEALRAFEQRAERASTPAQIAVLEQEVK